MLDVVAAVGFPLVLVAVLVWGMAREDARLRRRARRYRELELEGIEELPPYTDPYPEEAESPVGFLREPSGLAADPSRVLHDDLERAREHTRRQAAGHLRTRSLRRGKGAGCLL